MFIKLLTYSGISTKVKAIESRLLSKEDYNTIANLQSVPDFVLFLKKHPAYKDSFASVDEFDIHRGQIEALLINSLYNDYYRIYKFANLKQRKMMSLIFLRFEISVLKICFQRVYNHRERPVDISRSPFKAFFERHSNLNVDSLLSSRSIEEFINNLRDTKYYRFLKVLNNDSSNLTLFDYEMQLDIFYFREIWKLKGKYLKGSQLTALTHIYGNSIDLLNILWIYRSKNYYHIENSKILSYIIPINYKLKREELTRLMESNTLQDFQNILNQTHYGRKYAEETTGNLTQDTIEGRLNSIRSKLYREEKRINPFSIAPVNGYIFFKEQEIDRLTTALECIRYELEPNESLGYIFQRTQ